MNAQIDLKDVFSRVVPDIQETRPVRTLVCDVFDTLVDHSGTLNTPLCTFLYDLKKQGYEVVLTSTDPKAALAVLQDAGCDSRLLNIKNKMHLQADLMDKDVPYVVIDDNVLLWLDATIQLSPDDRNLTRILHQRMP